MHAYPLHISISIRRRKERVKKTGRGEEEKRCAFHLLRIISNPHISIMTRKQDCNALTPYFSISVVNSSLEAYINVSMHFCRREGMIEWSSSFSSPSLQNRILSPSLVDSFLFHSHAPLSLLPIRFDSILYQQPIFDVFNDSRGNYHSFVHSNKQQFHSLTILKFKNKERYN